MKSKIVAIDPGQIKCTRCKQVKESEDFTVSELKSRVERPRRCICRECQKKRNIEYNSQVKLGIRTVIKRDNAKPKFDRRVYGIWKHMIFRCTDTRSNAYANYGGKGISVCNSWETFGNFHLWALSNGYEEHLTIDRKESDKGYYAENCRWITLSENSKLKDNTSIPARTVLEIRRLRSEGLYYREISFILGVSSTYVGRVLRGTIRKNV